jgi:hypothetical protein
MWDREVKTYYNKTIQGTYLKLSKKMNHPLLSDCLKLVFVASTQHAALGNKTKERLA